MPRVVTNSEALLPHLKSCGYGDGQIAQSYAIDRTTIDVVAFAGKPWDCWSACVAAVNLNGDSKASAAKAAALGVATVFVCGPNQIDWWAMGSEGPTTSQMIPWNDVGAVFRRHRDELSPSRIYNAKLGRTPTSDAQLWFFDVGLMPAVEKNRGQTLLRLVERAISDLSGELSDRLHSRQAQEDVYRTVFWQLAAKILHDKRVPNFINIDLRDVDQVFERIGKHHGDTGRLPPFGREGRAIINAVAAGIADCGSLADVSSESIAYVYENALIDKAAGQRRARAGDAPYDIRKELGIHSTPQVLIQHMLSQLWPLIEEIRPEDRHVFEPACGHAPFLTGAIRWLRQWNRGGQPTTSHDYMRKHLEGLEADGFAIELAKLALTLADEPHGNSWDIRSTDMFLPGILAKEAKKARILLSNPPYEAFTDEQRLKYRRAGEPVTAQSKVVEMLARTLPHLPDGSVFGVVVPHGVLYQEEAIEIRRLLMSEFQFSEITLFADSLFEKGDAETAILLGRRSSQNQSRAMLQYRRVREKGMDAFKDRLEFSSERTIPQQRFTETPKFDFRIPDLDELWTNTRRLSTLSQIAHVQRGFTHEGMRLPLGAWTVEPFKRGRGAAGFTDIPRDLCIYGVPDERSVNLDADVIQSPRAGTTTGIPQVLLNYHPVSREPWRLKAMIDRDGHAVTGSFLTVRPLDCSFPLEYLWALLNSPMANAYVYCFSQKRHNLAGTVGRFPLPPMDPADTSTIVSAAREFLDCVQYTEAPPSRHRTTKKRAASARGAPDLFTGREFRGGPDVKSALLRLDAAVLRLYDLPPCLERQLLDLFDGVERKGVGCEFRRYYPQGFASCLPLHLVVSERFERAAANATDDRFKPGESEYVRHVLSVAATVGQEE